MLQEETVICVKGSSTLFMTTNIHSGDVALLYMEYKTDQNLRRMFREHFYKALKLRRSCLVVSFQGYNGFMGSLAF